VSMISQFAMGSFTFLLGWRPPCTSYYLPASQRMAGDR